jgi:RNA ligase
MAHLLDLFDMSMYEEMLKAGFVKVQRHPDYPDRLAIANYTKKAQTNYHWNAVTEQCRGLIFDPRTNEVIARPFRKFYNYDEPQADKILGLEEIRAFDKMDGSLGISYPIPGTDYEEYAIATRGSFASDQALWATAWLKERRGDMPFIPGVTDLFEIIYPENRIVVSYGEYEGLKYLGSINTHSGHFAYEDDMFDDRAELLYTGTLEGLMNRAARSNAEGFVVVASGNRRVKVKYEEYVRLHRIVTNLSERSVWELMGGPRPENIDDLSMQVDEEHRKWMHGVADDLVDSYWAAYHYAHHLHDQVTVLPSRRAQAIEVQELTGDKVMRGAVFALLDGKDIEALLWKSLYPKGE